MRPHPCPLPTSTLLDTYVQQGDYTDSYTVDVPGEVTMAQFVEAFYTTPIFKLERWILGKVISRPSTDEQARQLAQGSLSKFSAWTVELRETNQLLLAAGVTRSWLMVEPSKIQGATATSLYFGSAVVLPAGRTGLRWDFKATLGFHKFYSRILLSSAARKLAKASRHYAK
jgi:hypothetical protein